ncbi:hypothetical protein GOV14_02965 [Candidatus Pacearchaeota archaeon]|nr:hypothetical protein [Candidatus Pacearchaeota archaeon]
MRNIIKYHDRTVRQDHNTGSDDVQQVEVKRRQYLQSKNVSPWMPGTIADCYKHWNDEQTEQPIGQNLDTSL